MIYPFKQAADEDFNPATAKVVACMLFCFCGKNLSVKLEVEIVHLSIEALLYELVVDFEST